jgi:hypothetical protein
LRAKASNISYNPGVMTFEATSGNTAMPPRRRGIPRAMRRSP